MTKAVEEACVTGDCNGRWVAALADSVTRVKPELIKREGLMVCVNLIVTIKDVSMHN